MRREPGAVATGVALPRAVWALGLVSLCMDLSSELIHALLPLFMVGTLGVSFAMVGLIEGIAEATASFVKIGAGALSDRVGRRKPLVALGYGMAAASKLLFPLAATLSEIVVARLADRLGKGIRGAPRDALLADMTPPSLRGRAFGLRQALDSVGAVLGPLLATLLLVLLAGDIRAVFWVALLPAAASVAILLWGVHEPPAPAPVPGIKGERWGRLAALGPAFWGLLGVTAMIGLARFSEAFLILAASAGGLGERGAPLVMVAMSAIYAASAYPVGRLSDRIGRRGMLGGALVLLAAADLVFALVATPTGVIGGAVLWGLHMGASQGLLSALVADAAPAKARGLAFGLFNGVLGAALLGASLWCGLVWEIAGAAWAFAVGGVLALAALGALALWSYRAGAPRSGEP